jgi:hypothetical protein
MILSEAFVVLAGAVESMPFDEIDKLRAKIALRELQRMLLPLGAAQGAAGATIAEQIRVQKAKQEERVRRPPLREPAEGVQDTDVPQQAKEDRP